MRLVSEIDEDARATIVANRPDIPLIGDILDYTAAQVRAAAGIGDRDIDLIAGGPPCQPFSIAGKHLGLDDARGKLLLTFVNLALELAPRYIVVENAELMADDAFDMVLGMLRSGGYVVSFNLYDAAYFGAPQRRRRLIIIASRDGRVPHLTPSHSDRPEDGLAPWRTLRDAIGNMAGIKHHGARYSQKRVELWRHLKAGQDGRHLRDLAGAGDDAIGRKACYYRRLSWDVPAHFAHLSQQILERVLSPRREPAAQHRRIQAAPVFSGRVAGVRHPHGPVQATGQCRPGIVRASGRSGDPATHAREAPKTPCQVSRLAVRRDERRGLVRGRCREGQGLTRQTRRRSAVSARRRNGRCFVRDALRRARKAGRLLLEAIQGPVPEMQDRLFEPVGWGRTAACPTGCPGLHAHRQALEGTAKGVEAAFRVSTQP